MNGRSGQWAITLLVALSLLVGSAIGALAADDIIDVVVSPNVLNLDSSGGSVSLHTDFAYSRVAGTELTVNDKPVTCGTKQDDRGQLVVKCNMETIKGLLLEADGADFDLTVLDTAGVNHYGTDWIKVISQAGVNRKK